MDENSAQSNDGTGEIRDRWPSIYETRAGRRIVATALAVGMLAAGCATSSETADSEFDAANTPPAAVVNEDEIGNALAEDDTEGFYSREAVVTLDDASETPAEIKAMLPNEALVGSDALELIPETWLEVNSWAPDLLESLNGDFKEDGPTLVDRDAQIVFWRGVALSKNFAYDSPERLIMQNPMVIRRPSSKEMFLVSSILGTDEVYAGYYLGEYEKLYASREEGMMDTLFFPYPEQQNTGQYVVANIEAIHDSGYLGLYDLLEDELRDNQVTQYSFAVAINERSQIDGLVTNSSPNSAKWLAESTEDLSTDLLEYASRND